MNAKAPNQKPEQKQPERALVRLGDGKVFVTRTPTGEVSMVKAEVVLSEKMGEIYKVKGNARPTKGGYDRLNQIACINLLTPPSVIVDGKPRSNPHMERNERTGVIKSVVARRIGVGYGPTGSLCAIDHTFNFTIFSYLLQDIQTKLKKYPGLGMLGVSDKKPDKKKWEITRWTRGAGNVGTGEFKEESFENKQLVFFEIEDPVGIWLNLGHPEAEALFDQHTQRQKFADRIAQSILDRNIIAEHPAVATKTLRVNDAGLAAVTVYGFKSDMDVNKLQQMADKIATGEVDRSEIEVRSKVVDAEFEVVEDATIDAAEVESPASAKAKESMEVALGTEQTKIKEVKVKEEKKINPRTEQAPDPESKGPSISNEREKQNKEAALPSTKALNNLLEGGAKALGLDAYHVLLQKKYPGTKSAILLPDEDKKKFISILQRAVDEKAE